MVSKIEAIIKKGSTKLVAQRSGNVYVVDRSRECPRADACLFSAVSNKETELWHKRLGHTNLKTINEISKMA